MLHNLFEGCEDLGSLNKKRQELVEQGLDPKVINSEYNRIRSTVINKRDRRKLVPYFYADEKEYGVFTAFPILEVKDVNNVITITHEGVIV
ncbi:MAG: hypothetical protein LBS29_04810 [Endomicrobium sp.]|jgi:hypothetical protein|nr:hypothetical protein [Endomicrobium sp.]